MDASPTVDAAYDELSATSVEPSVTADGTAYAVVSVATGGRDDQFLLARGGDGDPMAFLRIDDQRDSRSFTISSVIDVAKVTMQADASMLPAGDVDFLRLRCDAPQLVRAFLRFLEEIRTKMEDEELDASRAVSRTAGDWRRLLSLAVVEQPREKLVGLFGELKALESLVEMYGPVALAWWVGPEGARHDFHGGRATLEIKTTTDLGRDQVTIHGLDQLDPVAGSAAGVLLMEVESSPDGESVDDLVGTLVEAGVPEEELLARLNKVRYMPGNTANDEFKFSVVERRVWRVTDESPGLRRSQVPDRLLEGVEDVRYRFPLSQLGAPLGESEFLELTDEFTNEEGN